MAEKQKHKLRLSDIIPVAGLVRYIHRNTKSYKEFSQLPEPIRYGAARRGTLLLLYNCALMTTGIAMAMNNGLEKLVN